MPRKYFTNPNKKLIEESVRKHWRDLIQHEFGRSDDTTGTWEIHSKCHCAMSAVIKDNKIKVTCCDKLTDLASFFGVETDVIWSFIFGFDSRDYKVMRDCHADKKIIYPEAFKFGREMWELRMRLLREAAQPCAS